MIPLRDENPTTLTPVVTVSLIVLNCLVFLLCGVAAVFGHAITAPDSTFPIVGASGAISGVLGAYLLLFPRARVLVLIPLGFLTRVMPVPAIVVLGLWIVMQIINGAFSWGGLGGGVAWFAHIGGFAVGLALIKVFQRRPVNDIFRW